MAGTAEGMARAREARRVKVEARRAARIASGAEDDRSSPIVANSQPIDPDNAPTVRLLTVADRANIEVSGNQTLEAQGILAATAQSAAITVQRVCSGRLRAPVAVRVQASLTVLQGLGYLGDRSGVGPTAEPAGAQIAVMLAAIERAAGLRARRDGAETVQPVTIEVEPSVDAAPAAIDGGN